MTKKIDASQQIGDGGIALIHVLVNAMGFVWHERKTDAGIDGEIELRDPSTGEVANKVLLVQSKATNRKFPGENDRKFHFVCTQSDVDYWMAAEEPVLLVCSHPGTGEAWWAHVQSCFKDPARRAARRVEFDKRTQRFDECAGHRLLHVADPHGRVHVPVAVRRKELLTSNLLEVEIPKLLYSAPTKLRDVREVVAQQIESGSPDVRRDFVLREKRIFTWSPLEETALRSAVSGPTDVHSTTEWESDPQRQRWLVQLLNEALRRDVAEDCAWHRGRKIVYFKANPDLSPRVMRSTTGRIRALVTPTARKDSPTEIGFLKHAALDWRFLLVGQQWFCVLNPTFHYTRDGQHESAYMSDLLAGIKRLDRNLAVLGHTVMWASYLKGDAGVFEPRETIITYGDLVTLTADSGIDDDLWLEGLGEQEEGVESGGDTAELAVEDVDELTLFEVEP